ncbi:MAG TPA: polyhydroxyalkanoate synthesis regulator DNA-binding domain-containing protein [Myxococcota bacterium]|nr:polyhydroxyalkanoate synthesis regulator DNA-binding domain-containing protein [Myxococcota bacterium]
MPVLIKRYANRKLYNTQTSRYITLKGIAELLEGGEDVRVIDNESGEDITSITLSQILVDTERSHRAPPGSLFSGIFQRGGDVLYEALSRGVDDASERIEDFQRTMRRLLRVRHGDADAANAIDDVDNGPDGRPFPPDFDQLVQRTIERVLRALDVPRRADIEALHARLDRLIDALGGRLPPDVRRDVEATRGVPDAKVGARERERERN